MNLHQRVKLLNKVMAQIIDPIPSDSSDPILCCYVNATSKMQVARITNVPNWYFERVVFPGQRLIFEAVASAQLEIHCGMMASAILSDTIPCIRLQIPTEADAASEDTSESDHDDASSPSSIGDEQAVDVSGFGSVRLPQENAGSVSASASASIQNQKTVMATAIGH